MSLFDFEKLQNAQQANLALVQNLSSSLFASVEKLGQLQYKALTELSATQFDYGSKLLAVRDPKAFFELQTAFFSPSSLLDRQLAFNRELVALATEAQEEVSKFGEQQIAAGSKQVDEWVEQVASSAPAVAEPAVTALKSAVSNANEAYESAQKVVKEAADIADKAVKQAAENSEKAAKQAAEAAEKSINTAAAAVTSSAPAAKTTRGATKAS
ncbi:phasin PhaP [Zobellella endophytica]|uniref:Phasin PhaP n=1 Tax=Zobellella endophytica TaxID=2116700 RepID=A0A2P7R4T0_9GAMM|nr:TIGR01841 family phasin [Zobellella endophytica]PSJ45227.1 phasin PhaP [Zobellella endophytica]